MIVFALLLFLSPREAPPPQSFTNRCAGCHGEDARGSAKAPGLAMNPRVAEQSVEQLLAYIEHGNPGAGMPSFAGLPAGDLMSLAQYLRHLNADMIVLPPPAKQPTGKMTWSAPQPGDWLTYNGNDSANRYSRLNQCPRLAQGQRGLSW
jgi:cytochrome c553